MRDHLLFTRSFGPIFGCMALTAFNDNFYKNAFIILITYALAAELDLNAPTLISIASACFILPFFLFSSIGGQLADKLPKFRLVRILKSIEMLLFVLAGLAMVSHHVAFMLAMLFLLGTQSAFFGPVKYAILPDLLPRERILAATGWVEAGTYISILLGSLLGALLVMREHGVIVVTVIMLVAGVIGIVAAWRVPVTRAALPDIRLDPNLLRGIWGMIRDACRTPAILAAILGISWFWSIGATYLTQLPIYAKEVVGGNEEVVTLFMATFTIFIAVGSLTCAGIVRRHARLPIPAIALAGVMLCGLDLVWTAHHLPTPSEPLFGITGYFSQGAHFRIVVDLAIMAFCGGLFIVPLYTLLQTDSAESERARTIASNNVVNAVFIAAASLLAAALYHAALFVSDVLLVFALLNVPVICLMLRQHRARR